MHVCSPQNPYCVESASVPASSLFRSLYALCFITGVFFMIKLLQLLQVGWVLLESNNFSVKSAIFSCIEDLNEPFQDI